MNYFVIQAVQAICEKLLAGGEFAMLGTKPSAAVVKNETMYFSVIVVLSDIDIMTVARLRSSLLANGSHHLSIYCSTGIHH